MKDDLQNIWQGAYETAVHIKDPKTFLAEMDEKFVDFNRKIKARDTREITVAVIMSLLLGYGLFVYKPLLTKIALLVGILYCLMVISFLLSVKWQRPLKLTLNTKEFLLAYKRYLLKERRLINNVLFWYLLPPATAIGLFFVGQGASWMVLLIMGSFVFVIYGYIYRINKRSVRKDFDPLINEIDETLHAFEEHSRDIHFESI